MIDEVPESELRTCGGVVPLSYSQSSVVLRSPNYDSDPLFGDLSSGIISCWWYVTSPSGKQVKLTWLDVATTDEYIHVYDHSPTSSSLLGQYDEISRFRGDVDENISPFVSTSGGITLRLYDESVGVNGKGFLANVSLAGTYNHEDVLPLISKCF